MTRYFAPTFLCVALVSFPPGCATMKRSQDTLDVQQLRIVDANGVPHMVLAASMPGRGRAVQGAGIIFNDAHGREIGVAAAGTPRVPARANLQMLQLQMLRPS